jgi:hypothetical protein
MPNEQVNGLEANRAERFGHPREAGRRGAQKREQNRLARLDSAREHIERVQLPRAIRSYDDPLEDGDPRARRYRFEAAKDTLDRVLPVSKHIEVDVRAQISALIAAFKQA